MALGDSLPQINLGVQGETQGVSTGIYEREIHRGALCDASPMATMMIDCETSPEDSADVVGSKAALSITLPQPSGRKMVESTMGDSEEAVVH
ncbi:hypothetical protein TNCV_741451 [Trichonephila clavipes]|nr:hypothetical protein TNCV_741451 [Trichonephila clavipes]